MTEITHVACPRVECGSSDAFSFNTEKHIGKCHSCGHGYPESGEEYYPWANKEYPLKVNPRMKEIKSSTFKGIRGISEEVAKKFGIQLQLDEHGNPVRYAYKYPHTVKYRDYNDKKNSWMKDKGLGMKHLFGPKFNSGSSKRIYITEGEFDAASLYEALGQTFPVKSLPSASIGDKFMQENYKYLSSFEEIVYAGEQDEAGSKAADRFYQTFPEKLFYVPLTKWKDANEALMKGDKEELKWAALKPQRYTPDNFFCSEDQFEKILREENPYEYTTTGHSGLDEKIRGWVKGGITFIKAPPGSGKTEVFRYAEYNILKSSDCKIAPLHMEEQKSTTLRGFATYDLNTNVRTKEDAADNGITEDQVIEATKRATKGDRTIVFEMRQGDDPMRLIEYVKLACSVYGADYVFVDHVQRLAYLGGVDNATNILTKMAANLAQICKELNVGVIFISHVNEEGRTKYASSLEEEAIIVLRIERDKQSPDETTQNTTAFYVEKNRPFSKLGAAGHVYYDPETTILEEVVL